MIDDAVALRAMRDQIASKPQLLPPCEKYQPSPSLAIVNPTQTARPRPASPSPGPWLATALSSIVRQAPVAPRSQTSPDRSAWSTDPRRRVPDRRAMARRQAGRFDRARARPAIADSAAAAARKCCWSCRSDRAPFTHDEREWLAEHVGERELLDRDRAAGVLVAGHRRAADAHGAAIRRRLAVEDLDDRRRGASGCIRESRSRRRCPRYGSSAFAA